MNAATLRFLGIVVLVLVAALLLVESGDDSELPESGTRLMPEFRAVANDVDRLVVTRAGKPPLEIARQEDGWRVPDRDGYPADIAHVRNVLLAMADAAVVEAKTANPEFHSQLGVDAPTGELSKGVLITASAGEQRFEVIFGNAAQGSYRYARIASEDQSWLIDQNPDIPTDVGDWLDANIIDIDSSDVRSVTISHPDADTIAVSKAAREDVNFEVADIPEGRELSYSTVANGIGGALNDLDLDDVRRAAEADETAVVTVFETFDGVKITATTVKSDDGNWVGFAVEATGDDADRAAEIGARVHGWQYRIADYKANLLTRRWDDILKALPAEAE